MFVATISAAITPLPEIRKENPDITQKHEIYPKNQVLFLLSFIFQTHLHGLDLNTKIFFFDIYPKFYFISNHIQVTNFDFLNDNFTKADKKRISREQ